ncbi:Eukaryotic translation initiation factor 4B, partial [Kickxella alabastrina]
MSLVDFLGEGASTTSWADDEIYLPSAPMASTGASAADSSGYARRDYGGSSGIQSDRAAVDFPTSPPYTSFVGNLSFNADEAALRDFFAGLPVDSVRLIRDRENDKPKGYGYVQFADLESLKVAVGMDGRDLGGRPVRINVSEQRQDNARESAPTGPWRRPAGEDTATSPFASRSSSGFGRPQRDFAAASSAADSGDWRSSRPEPSATAYAAAPPPQVRERREFREPRESAEASAADAGDWRVNRPEPSATAYAAAPPPQVRERREFREPREPREPSAADAGDWRVNRPEPADIRTVFGNDRSPSATRTGRVRRDSPAGATAPAAADAAADDGADAAAAAVQGEEAGAWRKDKPTMPRDYQPARERSESREPRVQRKPREPREPVAESSWRVAR